MDIRLWKQLCLDFFGDGQLVFQTLFLLLLLDELLQRGGHGVESGGQGCDLVIGFDWNAMAEVATVDQHGAFVKLGYGAGHGAGEASADHDCGDLDHGEDDSDHQQEPLDCGGDVSQRIK